ncbi:MAG: hypothetical protein ACI4OW_02220 [Alphaproteobacteria bacterium]
MDAKSAAAKINSGLDNISVSELLELYKSLKGNNEYAAEMVSLNEYARNHIAAFNDAKFGISLEDAVEYQRMINTFGRDENGNLTEEAKIAQEKIKTMAAEAKKETLGTKLTDAQKAILDEHGFMYDETVESLGKYQSLEAALKILKDEGQEVKVNATSKKQEVSPEIPAEDAQENDEIVHNVHETKKSTLDNNAGILDEEIDDENMVADDKSKVAEFEKIVDRIKITDEQSGVPSQIYVDKLIGASFLEAQALSLGDTQVEKMTDKEKNKKLLDDFLSIALTKIASTAAADSIRKPKGKECDPRSPEYKTYLQEYSVKVKDTLNNVLGDKDKPINLSAGNVITSCADSTVKLEDYVRTLGNKVGSSKVVKKFKEEVQSFDKGCREIWKNKWDIAKGVVASVRRNKWQVGLGLTGSAAVTGAAVLAPEVTLPVMVGYMAYTSATAWVAPILDEAAALRKDAKKQGKKLGLFASLKQARKNKVADDTYKRKAAINTGFAILGGGLIGVGHVAGWFGGAAASVSDKITPAAAAVSERVISTVSRVAGSNTALAVERHFAKKAYKNASEDQKEDLRKNFVAADHALKFGLIVGALTTYVGLSHGAGNSQQIADNAFSDAAHGGNGVTDVDVDANGAADVNTDGTSGVDIAADDYFVEKIPEHNSDMGITKGQYETLMSTRSPEDLLRMYNNLDDDMMKNFDGMTREQVLYKYNRLDAVTKIVNAKKGVSIDGATRHNWDTELKDLKSMLECGDQLSAERMAAAKGALMHIKDNGQYVGPGADKGVSDFYLRKVDGRPCPEDNINYYAHGGKGGAVKPVVPEGKPQEDVEPVVVNEPVEKDPIDNNGGTPVDTNPTPAPEVNPTEKTKYVPYNLKFNTETDKIDGNMMEYMKGKGIVRTADGRYWIPSTDGKGIELDVMTKEETAALADRQRVDGEYKVRNSGQMRDSFINSKGNDGR